MAKSKETDETVTSDAESVLAPAASAPEVKSTKRKFKLLGGKHHVGSKVYQVGDYIESDDDLVAIYGRPKFELVQG